MMELFTNPDLWAALLTLTALEIVLGIDNVIFLSIVSGKLPAHQQQKARRIGLILALVMRVALLSSVSWIAGLTAPIVTLGDFALSWRDVVLGFGGLFLLYKGTHEIHNSMEGDEEEEGARATTTFAAAIMQIVVLDVVFSLDSVITAVGMTDNLPVMISAIVIAILVMMFAAEPVSAFVSRHPTVKMLALGFLLLVGMALMADAAHFHIPRGYLYFAIGFSILIESLNLIAAGRRKKAREARKGKAL
ncbi:MAG: TerC family protein [Rhodospirillaceae bacterium]|nr:TerC family protein [Rhodospirillaceae bacterium]